MQLNANTEITYLGHSTFVVQTPGGKRIIIDPFLSQNPLCPEGCKSADALGKVDIMLLTHGHFDHICDAVEIGKKYQPQTYATFESAQWLQGKGLTNVHMMNKGGTMPFPGENKLKFTFSHALHSSSIQDGDQMIYAGEPGSFILHLEDGFRIFHAGDTMLFGDMKLIGEIHQPDLGLIPIGDCFTMGPKEAAMACEFLKVKKAVPMHYATFPVLTGTPAQFGDALHGSGIEMIELKPGESC